MSTVSDYIAAMEDDELAFRRLTTQLLSGAAGQEVKEMADAVKFEEEHDLVDFDDLMKGVTNYRRNDGQV